MKNESGSSEPHPDSTAPRAKQTNMVLVGLRALLWSLLVVVVIGIFAAQQAAPNSDHAIINILTAGLSFLAWLVLLLALMTSGGLQSLVKWVAAAPFVALIVFIGLFRFERLDSELVPQFRPRWESPESLPTQSTNAAEQAVANEIFTATEADFPQFLGPDRNAQIDLAIATNWESDPPTIDWKQAIGEGWSGFAIQGQAAITMEQRDATEWVSAYSLQDGTLLWNYEIEGLHTTVPGGAGPRSTPAIYNDKVYACSAVSHVVCLNLFTGEEVWKHDLLALADTNQAEFETSVVWGRSGSPLAFDNLVIVPFGGSPSNATTLLALEVDTGEIVWRGGQGQISYSSPMLATLDGVKQILLISENKLAAYAIADGQVLWEFPWPGNSNANPAVPQPLIVDETHVLLSKGYGEGSMLIQVQQQADQWKPSKVWQNKTVMKAKFSNPVIHDGYVYGLSDGILECVSLQDGQRQWKRGRYRHGQMLLLQDKLLILSEAGELAVVPATPDAYQELASMQVISGVSWNTLALAGDRLLVRNSDEAACVKLPIVETATIASDSDSQAANNSAL